VIGRHDRYTSFTFIVRSFTWKYATDDGPALKEFSRTGLVANPHTPQDPLLPSLLMMLLRK
jgi:hypothetical protein